MSRKFVFKVIVIGNPAVGKTSLIKRFSEHKFETEYKPTLGANILIKEVEIENILIKLLLYDIAGQMKWSEVRQLYYKGAQGAIIVYDCTRPGTFNSITKWHGELLKNAGAIPKVLLGNKVDLKDKRKIDSTQGAELASELNCHFFETSALNGTKVVDAFNNIAKTLLNRQ
ncbi:MAG: GTP-binding protein [Candidatus Helarchaeota archaeon]|nr:GTP-binding protein [Candidatus Helarchaeota archaeon]